MTQYYIADSEGKIKFVDDDIERLKNTLLFLPEYTENDIKKCKKNYIIDNFEMMTKAAYNTKQAEKTQTNLINEIYKIKAAKAYGGVVINDIIKFETNQTAITNTVASLALMSDDTKTSWKFYTIEGLPYVQLITKAQLGYIATFGQNMINECFKIEGAANEALNAASEDDLLNSEWVESFKNDVQTKMNAVVNTLSIDFNKTTIDTEVTADDNSTDTTQSDTISDEVETENTDTETQSDNTNTDTASEQEESADTAGGNT